ncbi:MAG TPA: methyltransferase domain-containing protein, partial [Acidobacteriota bacterium]|nr:methyltransferase domain-containing protein [Acidobacteriota bacterium]
KLDLIGLTNVELIRGVAESIPLPDGTVDLITSNNGINNVTDIPKSFRECYRVARPGAQFVFTMNADTTMMEFYSVLEQVLNENHLQSAVSSMKNHIYEKRKPATEIREWLLQSGFVVNRTMVDSFVFRYADGTAMLNHYFIYSGFMRSWVKLVPHDRLELVFDGVERRLNAAAEKQGELRMTIPFLTFDCEK